MKLYFFNRIQHLTCTVLCYIPLIFSGVPGTYTFSYGFSDSDTRNYQYRVEERYPNGSVIGIYEYGYPIGSHKAFKYIADENGYR